MLMAHTLNDLVVRSCEEDEAALRGSSLDGLDSLRAQTTFFETEAASLRSALATELAKLRLALASRSPSGANATGGGGGAYEAWAMPAASAYAAPLLMGAAK